MQANIDTRKPLTERQIIKNFAIILANARGEVEKRGDLDAQDRLQRIEALLDHFIEISVENNVIATWKYKPLSIKEV